LYLFGLVYINPHTTQTPGNNMEHTNDSHDNIIETHTPTPNMTAFFKNLEDIKAKIKSQYEETQDPFLLEIYNQFHATFKPESDQ